MSSGATHMIIGATAGVLVCKILNIPLVNTTTPNTMALGLIGASTFLATIPDIDEPKSWIGQKVTGAICLLCMLLSGALIWLKSIDVFPGPIWFEALIGGALGLVLIGPYIARGVLLFIRRGAGGHRRLTHSFVVASILGCLAWLFWSNGHLSGAVIPGAIAYAIVVHGIGDLVTPAGLPLFYPLSKQRIGLPRWIARRGEALILILSVITLALLV